MNNNGGGKLKENKTEFKEVKHHYTISSKELKDQLGLSGEILNIGLHTGRSPNDIEEGVSADKDVWYISTQERAIQ